MNGSQATLLGLATLATTFGIYHADRHIRVKREAFNYARNLVGDKGIINLGAGPHRTLIAQEIAKALEVVINLDIVPDGLPNFMQYNLEEIPWPFGENEFDVSFASHIIEHLENWESALTETSRIADYAVVVLPHPHTGWINPDHKYHFREHDMRNIADQFPNLVVFY